MSSPQNPQNTPKSEGDARQSLECLETIVREMGSVLVCFSGGIDSALLLSVANRVLGDKAVGLTAVSPSLPEVERAAAMEVARELGAQHHSVSSNEMARPGYTANGPDRCFYCKTELYTIAEAKRREWGLSWIANGTNTDDLGDYRPGLEAAKNANVRAPFVEAGMSKNDVRAVARLLELPIWDKPAAACLSSRIPYGTSVTKERLRQVESLETTLRELGYRGARVRWHDAVARIEVREEDLPRLVTPEHRKRLIAAAKESGFKFATVDLSGYQTGSLNALLEGRALKVVS